MEITSLSCSITHKVDLAKAFGQRSSFGSKNLPLSVLWSWSSFFALTGKNDLLFLQKSSRWVRISSPACAGEIFSNGALSDGLFHEGLKTKIGNGLTMRLMSSVFRCVLLQRFNLLIKQIARIFRDETCWQKQNVTKHNNRAERRSELMVRAVLKLCVK